MSINLLKKVQETLGYPALHKVDPNVQDVPLDPTVPDMNRFAQAAIPSVLTALYKYSKTDEGAATIIREINSTTWADELFCGNKDEAIANISSYSGHQGGDVEHKLNEIAAAAVRELNSHLKEPHQGKQLQALITGERNDFLHYLPAVLNMGKILGDNTLDDKTNKMEGPISSLMHKIESGFSTPK